MPKVEMGQGEMRSRAGSHPSAGGSGMPQYHDDPNGVEPSLAASANDLGAKLYATYCMHCHGSNGRAFAPLLAPLAGKPAVLEPNPTSMINVILNGAQALVINGLPAAYPMPKFSNVLVRCGEIARGNGPCG
ncbi:c-type cytochrome [Paraburkholderia sp. JPY419]|uniref:c-type cytochrome n=1 Tax=Paraburkholderia sp. JPY419 TaxID=667660 RepID=UPI003D1A2703